MRFIAKLVLVLSLFQLLDDIWPDFIQRRATVDALIADSVEEMKGKVIRAVAIHVSIISNGTYTSNKKRLSFKKYIYCPVPTDFYN